MKYGYLRVSTKSQSNEKFYQALYDAGVPSNQIIEETVSGAKSWKRRKLGKLVDSLSSGDEIIVPELSRLGRGAADVLDLRDALMERGITVHTLKEGYRIGAGMRAADKMVITIMAAVNEMERDFLSERTREGLAHAKAQGKKLGGPRRKGHKVQEMTNDDQGERNGGRRALPCRDAALRAVRAGNSISGTASRYGVSRATIHRWIKQ